MAHALIAYYSRAGENYCSGQLRILKEGNTALAAAQLQAMNGADLFRIEQVVPYSDGYNECIEQARTHQQHNARPVLAAFPTGAEQYDTLYLGYPNYWGTMPMAVFTFLEQFPTAGKVILPFCTHEGSGLGSSVADIRRLCPGADVRPGLALRGSRIAEARPAFQNWLKEENAR